MRRIYKKIYRRLCSNDKLSSLSFLIFFLIEIDGEFVFFSSIDYEKGRWVNLSTVKDRTSKKIFTLLEMIDFYFISFCIQIVGGTNPIKLFTSTSYQKNNLECASELFSHYRRWRGQKKLKNLTVSTLWLCLRLNRTLFEDVSNSKDSIFYSWNFEQHWKRENSCWKILLNMFPSYIWVSFTRFYLTLIYLC